MAHTHSHSIVAALTVALAGGWAAETNAQITWYVDADAPPGGDGLGWSSAFDDLQPAMELALPGDEIWVAEGVYVPSVIDPIAGEDQPYFLMPDGVAILGGFRGDETSADQRDPDVFESVISGDLLGNDLDTPITGKIGSSQGMIDLFLSIEENTGTLLFLDRTGIGTRVDGVVFEGAFTEPDIPGSGSPQIENGVFAIGAIADFVGCTFRRNIGTPGGALFIIDCGPEHIADDFAAVHPCGGLSVSQPSAVVISECLFEDNIDGFRNFPFNNVGAAVTIVNSVAIVEHSTVRYSRLPDLLNRLDAEVGQAGIWFQFGSHGIVTDSLFERCSPSYLNSTNFGRAENVTAIGVGVGQPGEPLSEVEITRCEFRNNQTTSGTVRFYNGSGSVASSSFLGNSAVDTLTIRGVAVTGIGRSFPPLPGLSVTDCEFVGNIALNDRDPNEFLQVPVVSSFITSGEFIRNTFHANGAWADGLPGEQLRLGRPDGLVVSSNLFAEEIDSLDPLFVRPASNGGDRFGDDPSTPDVDESANDHFGDLRLQPGSPAIDQGLGDFFIASPEFDLAGGDRFVDDPGVPPGSSNGTPADLGAYEFQGVTCLPDTNGDGLVAPSDFNAWIFAFNAGSPLADQNRDGGITPSDFNAWVLNYNADCP